MTEEQKVINDFVMSFVNENELVSTDEVRLNGEYDDIINSCEDLAKRIDLGEFVPSDDVLKDAEGDANLHREREGG